VHDTAVGGEHVDVAHRATSTSRSSCTKSARASACCQPSRQGQAGLTLSGAGRRRIAEIASPPEARGRSARRRAGDGAIAQNVYCLLAASAGLATAQRAWIDRAAIADTRGLVHDQQVLRSRTAGQPRR